MKVRVGCGRPMTINRHQTLQSRLFAPRREFIDSRFQPRYTNGSDWRVWSASEDFGREVASPTTNPSEAFTKYEVSILCLRKWRADSAETNSSGYVCICGHPESAHQSGGLCAVGSMACLCRKPRPAIWVDDIRFFYRATKGPHEAHALVMGIGELLSNGGMGRYVLPWICEMQSCKGRTGVNPARFRKNNALALGMSVHDNHKLICEPCLFRNLNGGYIYE